MNNKNEIVNRLAMTYALNYMQVAVSSPDIQTSTFANTLTTSTTMKPISGIEIDNIEINSPIEREWRAFQSMSDEIKALYKDQYVAIYGGKIVDSDFNRADLVDRFYQTKGNVVVYIGKIGETKKVHKILTPFRKK